MSLTFAQDTKEKVGAGDISGGTEDISARIFRRQRRETEDISRT